MHHVPQKSRLMTCRLSSKPQLDDKECCILPNDVLPISKFRPFGLEFLPTPHAIQPGLSPLFCYCAGLFREWARDNPSSLGSLVKTGAKCKCVMCDGLGAGLSRKMNSVCCVTVRTKNPTSPRESPDHSAWRRSRAKFAFQVSFVYFWGAQYYLYLLTN